MSRSSPSRSVSITLFVALLTLIGCGSSGTASTRGPVVVTTGTVPSTNRAAPAESAPIVASAGAALADSDVLPVTGAPMIGANNGLVTIVEFGDFECPFCARVEPTLADVRTRYPNDVRIVWRNRPLPFHSHARLAAEAAMAAGAQGRFWEMHDLLFQNQRALERADLEQYATQLQLDMARFRSDLDQHSFAAAIDADIAMADHFEASGVPHFFINGARFVGAQPIERFTAAIDQTLARARTMPPGRAYADSVRDAIANHADLNPVPSAPTPPRHYRNVDATALYRVDVGDSPVLGPADALVTIVAFSDFQCPFCSRVEPTLATIRDRYRNDVRIVWKNNPLPFHDHAMEAAEAAMEIYRQQGAGGFWRYHDQLFGNQRALDRASLEQYARNEQADLNEFRNALDSHRHAQRIHDDMQLATALEQTGTPTFFINGHLLVGAQPVDRFVTAIDAALVEARAAVAHGVARAAVYAHLTANGSTRAVITAGSDDGGAGNDSPNRVYTVRSNPRAPFRGGAHARVVLEHFSDFQCPFCSRIEPSIQAVLRQYGDRVRLVWRDYPLPFHVHAMLAAEAAREVYAQRGNDAFWRFHDLLFQNQSALERADLERYAQQVGANLPRFRRALDRHTHQAEVQEDIAAATASGTEIGTPATFVNGHLVLGAQPVEAFQRVIDAELAAPARH